MRKRGNTDRTRARATKVAAMSEAHDTPPHLQHDSLPAWHHLEDFHYWKYRADGHALTEKEGELMDLAILKRELEDMIHIRAYNATWGDDRLTWTQIGRALGISRQAAAKRFSKPRQKRE